MREQAPTPVGLFPTGAADWGHTGKLRDIAGNVWEWCSDELSTEGKPQSGGPVRPLRGGCCWFDASYLVVSVSLAFRATIWRGNVGFRVVRCGGSALPSIGR